MDNKNREDHRIARSCIVSTIMAVQTQLAFLLTIIALVHGGIAPLSRIKQTLLISANNEDITANLDELVDNLLPSIRKFILEYGMDPIDLIDLSENIFPHLPGKLKGNVDLKKGWMQNLSHLKRSGHVTATYKDKIMKLDMNFGFDVMDFNYEYYLKYLLYERQGDVYGRFYNLEVNVVVTVDLANYHLSLDSLKFSKIGKYDIKFEGHILDRILNKLTKVVTVVFKKLVLTNIENRSIIIFRAKLDEWNDKLSINNQ